jgi:hypothetical protein
MRVWRIEDPEKRMGPWQSPMRVKAALEAINGHSPYDGPTPKEDAGVNLWDQPDRVCACTSPKQLCKWFHEPHRYLLANAGFVVGEYEAPDDTPCGSWQCVPRKADMVHIADHSPLSI